MKYLIILLFCFSTANAYEIQQSDILKKLAAPYDAAIAFYPASKGTVYVSDIKKATAEYLPASTFKIPHALAALDSGIISPDTVFKWDGTKRGTDVWNRDMTMRDAIRTSAVWVFEETGRKLGQDVLNVYVSAFDYGNRDISGEYPFWLIGNLRISPVEQIDFLYKFNTNYFRLNQAAVRYVQDAMLSGSFKGCTLYGKTGWATKDRSGWYVGYYECPDETYYFAVRIATDSPEHLKLRQQLAGEAAGIFINQ
ncbi:penicillin-binding transpeptidase domain-containing protein [Seleniivibrio woodruffii]|uniref:penicillin-binding transpeptidase domain-containing protein n=1 Tax=Seleniivibrio woodruffii TaxID=1078050 RepID=UPI0026F0AAEC|nr:penicillin-binding transpeptidase domain-containing protein [Seleniivibrio woodruffii]